MISLIKKVMTCPTSVLAGIIGVSVFSLAAALIAETVFGLEPCILCLYQRGPYATAILIGVIGLIYRKHERIAQGAILLAGFNFLTNAVIAAYHSGIERHFWQSAVEGCKVSFNAGKQNFIENIMSTPAGRCDEIPWADPVFGLSMANYNVMLCAGLFAVCVASFIMLRQKR